MKKTLTLHQEIDKRKCVMLMSDEMAKVGCVCVYGLLLKSALLISKPIINLLPWLSGVLLHELYKHQFYSMCQKNFKLVMSYRLGFDSTKNSFIKISRIALVFIT